MEATTLKRKASTAKPSSAREVLGEAARESTCLLGIAFVALAYAALVVAVVVFGDDVIRAFAHSLPSAGH